MLTDDQVRAYLVLAAKVPGTAWVKDFPAFKQASMDIGPALAEEVIALRLFKRAVRDMEVHDFHAADDEHWWKCSLCTCIWRDGEAEAHKPSCLLAIATP